MIVPRLLTGLSLAVLAAPALVATQQNPPAAAAPAAVRAAGSAGAADAAPALDVRVVTDEPEQVLAIVARRKAGQTIDEADWQRLFATEGYVRLKKRETSMRREFKDEDFKAFVLSPDTAAAAPGLAAALAGWNSLDAAGAAARARAYLPPGTPLRARIYPSIKPRPNSFVFELSTNPAIFMYIDPARTAAVLQNTLSHELHHVGFAAACQPGMKTRLASYSGGAKDAVDAIGSFSEGLAMVAAAGGPDVHPHAVSAPADRERWDKDVANADADLRKVEAYLLDLAEGRLTDPAEIQKAHMAFFGLQGPWYTVGWKMAVTIEKAYGRQAVIDSFCDWTTLLATYNRAAAESNAKGGAPLPLWSPKLIDAIR